MCEYIKLIDVPREVITLMRFKIQPNLLSNKRSFIFISQIQLYGFKIYWLIEMNGCSTFVHYASTLF